jgi:hypothetical protein
MRPVTVTKLSSTDAFVVTDLDDAPAAGIVRCARKILVGGAEDLARLATYAFAACGLQVGGASAGINAEGDDRDAAVAAFVEELGPRAASLRLGAGKGVDATELAPFGAMAADVEDRLLAASVVACVAAVRDLAGARVALEDVGRAGPELSAAFEAAGATVVAQGATAQTTDCDVVGVGWKTGVVDHENVAGLAGRIVVPLAPLAVTTRALAAGRRAGVTVLPDFLSTTGPLLGPSLIEGRTDDADVLATAVTSAITAAATVAAGHADGPSIGACEAAETFLLTWRDELPFGRPI